jgi:hypothetical protein
MSFKENYTTTEKKEETINDKNKSQDEKDKEDKKTIVSNDAFLQAEMLDNLNKCLEQLRISSILRK